MPSCPGNASSKRASILCFEPYSSLTEIGLRSRIGVTSQHSTIGGFFPPLQLSPQSFLGGEREKMASVFDSEKFSSLARLGLAHKFLQPRNCFLQFRGQSDKSRIARRQRGVVERRRRREQIGRDHEIGIGKNSDECLELGGAAARIEQIIFQDLLLLRIAHVGPGKIIRSSRFATLHQSRISL